MTWKLPPQYQPHSNNNPALFRPRATNCLNLTTSIENFALNYYRINPCHRPVLISMTHHAALLKFSTTKLTETPVFLVAILYMHVVTMFRETPHASSVYISVFWCGMLGSRDRFGTFHPPHHQPPLRFSENCLGLAHPILGAVWSSDRTVVLISQPKLIHW